MKGNRPIRPPRLADRLFEWFCGRAFVEDLLGDMEEMFLANLKRMPASRARLKYWLQVLGLIFSYAIKRRKQESAYSHHSYSPIHPAMISNYLKIAARNLLHNKGYAFINVAGLTAGMTVALLIALWAFDEVTYDRNFANYSTIGQVWTTNKVNGNLLSDRSTPWLMAEELRNSFGSDFKQVLQSTWTESHNLAVGDKKYYKRGNFIEPGVTEMLSLKMIYGDRNGLKEPHSILLSASVAKVFFGDSDPVNQMIRVDRTEVKVTGVYEDFPRNSSFKEMSYILPWELFVIRNPFLKQMDDPWSGNFTQAFVQLADGVDFGTVSQKIKDIKIKKLKNAQDINARPEVFIHPMSSWHLNSEFRNGRPAGGRIELVWLFGIIGIFVLALACINFMNLSTARSERRAKEVGIRKSIGSARGQLVTQFLSESTVLALAALVLSLLITQLLMPAFNLVADKQLALPWTAPIFWLAAIGFSLLTGLLAGSYPAIFLSSFQPATVLKGSFMGGAQASLPRKVLIVLQFTVSSSLIIGTLVVYRQIEFARNRPVGYDRGGLINMLLTRDLHSNFDVVRNELKASNAIVEMSESGSPPTEVWNSNSFFNWRGKDPALTVEFPNTDVSYEYGKTVGWQLVAGRDFSREYPSDSAAFILNETSAKFIVINDPIGETITWNGRNYKVVGVIRDIVVESPYEPVRPSLYRLCDKDGGNVAVLRLNPEMDLHQTLSVIEKIYTKYSPSTPFDFKFVDEEYARKFGDEERAGRLSGSFATLAIFISCLGIFGLSSFMAERRRKEIGIRKVMGASVISVWQMLSRDFLLLVLIALLITIPLSFYFMGAWLQKFGYRTDLPWWIFVNTALGTLFITLVTVSLQSLKAAFANPASSLKTE